MSCKCQSNLNGVCAGSSCLTIIWSTIGTLWYWEVKGRCFIAIIMHANLLKIKEQKRWEESNQNCQKAPAHILFPSLSS